MGLSVTLLLHIKFQQPAQGSAAKLPFSSTQSTNNILR